MNKLPKLAAILSMLLILNQAGSAAETDRLRTNDLTNMDGTNVNSAVDNTRQNQRDRDSRNLTPMDQGSSDADVNTTKQIRQEITAKKDLSMNARNVKVITNNGKITLRGPVKTADEKRLIEEIANRAANGQTVDSQLEVKETVSDR